MRRRALVGAALLAAAAAATGALPAGRRAGADAPTAARSGRTPDARGGAAHRPLALHPQNPRYFLFRGRPTVLVTSAEHYGAVLNLDFEHRPYLDELARHGFNLTRVFTGAYVEPPGAFDIQNNTLAPAPGRFICPWARSAEGGGRPGYAGGGPRFDLSRRDEAYFRRLRSFVAEASRRGIVVEVVLFCPYYEEAQWRYSPFHPENNIQGLGAVPRTEVLTLKHPALLRVQRQMVRDVVAALREFDNCYFEICNEPYFGGVTAEWQAHIAETIAAAEADLPHRHLIAQNIANGAARVERPNPLVSIFNFHYANPPDAVALNDHLNRPIGFDETGFQGTGDTRYRTDGWEFLLAGGAIYDNLDYSFTTEHPDGTARVTPPTPGGGGPALRAQLAVLKRFIESFDFLRMRPANEAIRGGVPPGATARCLAEPGRAYAIYVKGGGQTTLELEAPPGRYRAESIDPRTGAVTRREEARIPEGGRDSRLRLASPPYPEDIALRVVAVGKR